RADFHAGRIRHLQAVLPGVRHALRSRSAGHGREPVLFRSAAARLDGAVRHERARRACAGRRRVHRGAGGGAHADRCLAEPRAAHLHPPGLFLTFMRMSTVLEIVMISRKRHGMAAVTYAVSDIGRTLLFILPALLVASLHAVFVGATVFAAARLTLMLAALW